MSERIDHVATQTYEDIDVTDWTIVGDEVLGTKPKRWLRHPETGEHWLMKDATYSQRNDGTRYRKGDDWSERVANGVAARLGLPAARTELASSRTGEAHKLGVISRSVLATSQGDNVKEVLIPGNQLLAEPVAGRDRSTYTPTTIRDALEGVHVPDGVDAGLTAWDVFAGYLVLDAVVGNTDRHEENWAVLDRAGHRCLAPTFDHASCLGFQFADEQRRDRLRTRDSGYTPEAYADRAKTHFAGRPHPIAIARQAIEMPGTDSQGLWMDRCREVDRLVEPLLLIPEDRMSLPAREFAERVLRRNCQRLLDRHD